jgi:RimJ/RimL family protein N-acetyltransferase
MNITFKHIDDEQLLTETMRHPRIYPHITDDSCPTSENFEAKILPGFLYLGVFDDDEYLGLFLVQQHNLVLYEVHTCLLPSAWGARASAAAKAVIRWMFENTTCQRFITAVPEDNPLALRFARNAGMVRYGVNPKSLQRNGILIDQTLLGLNKE